MAEEEGRAATSLYVYFNSENSRDRTPHIIDDASVQYTCDGAEGTITFDGYYYVEDHAPPYPEDEALEPWQRPTRRDQWLPKILQLYICRRDKEPYKVDPIPPTVFSEESGISSIGGHTYHYHTREEYAYNVEIYKRVVHECTDRISEEEDDDGTPMQICFFPTNRQTLYFRVLETLLEKVTEE